MKPLASAVSILAFATPAFAADPAEGLWLVRGGGGVVELAPCAKTPARLCGTIRWLRGPEHIGATDSENPIHALRARPLLGLAVVWDQHRLGSGRWAGGKIYDPNTGRTYESRLTLQRNGALKVQACVTVVCQTQSWTRTTLP